MTAAAERVRSALEKLADHDFYVEGPIGVLDQAQLHFRRPFAPAAVRWKVQTARKGWGTVVAYIDARLVIDRLNMVVGGEWSDEYAARGQGVEECALSVLGTTRRDVGKAAGGIEPEKAARSDALKRTAVKFGIGASIYVLKAVDLRATSEWDPDGDRLLIANTSKTVNGKERWSARMSTLAEKWLAETYARWLDARGVRLFGPVLDHGDEEGSQGLEGPEAGAAADAPEEAAEAGQEAIGEPVVDEATAAAVEQAAAVFEEIKALNPRQIPPGRHKTRLAKDQAKGAAAVEKYAGELRGVLATMKEARS